MFPSEWICSQVREGWNCGQLCGQAAFLANMSGVFLGDDVGGVPRSMGLRPNTRRSGLWRALRPCDISVKYVWDFLGDDVGGVSRVNGFAAKYEKVGTVESFTAVRHFLKIVTSSQSFSVSR